MIIYQKSLIAESKRNEIAIIILLYKREKEKVNKKQRIESEEIATRRSSVFVHFALEG
jgi:hypothetical protein